MKRVTLTLAVAAVLVAACSSAGTSGEPSASPTIGPPVYVDPSFGYQLTYAEPFKHGIGADIQSNGSANNPPASNVMFYDANQKVTRADSSLVPEGSTVYPVTLTVSVFPLAEAVTAENLPQAKAQLEKKVIPQLQSPGTKFSQLTETTLATRPAFTTTVTSGAETMKLFFFFDGESQYQVTTQAPTTQWRKTQPTFEKMLGSLTLPGTWASASPSAIESPRESRPSGNSPAPNGPTASRLAPSGS